MKDQNKEGGKDPLRKSCDYCARMKRACDGLDPCELCLRRRKQCTRSVKRKSGPAKGAKYAPRIKKRDVESAQPGAQIGGSAKQDRWKDKRGVGGGTRGGDAERRIPFNGSLESSTGGRSDLESSWGGPTMKRDPVASARQANGVALSGDGESGAGDQGDRGVRKDDAKGETQPIATDSLTLASNSRPALGTGSGLPSLSLRPSEALVENIGRAGCPVADRGVSGEPQRRFGSRDCTAIPNSPSTLAMEVDSGRTGFPESHPRKSVKQRASEAAAMEVVGSPGSGASLEVGEPSDRRASDRVGSIKREDHIREGWANYAANKAELGGGGGAVNGYSAPEKAAPPPPTPSRSVASSRASDGSQNREDGRPQASSRAGVEIEPHPRDSKASGCFKESEDRSKQDEGGRRAPPRDDQASSSESDGFAAQRGNGRPEKEASVSPGCTPSEAGGTRLVVRQERPWNEFSAEHSSKHGGAERRSSSPLARDEESGLPPLNHFWDRSTTVGKRADEIDRYVRRSIGQSVFQRNLSAPIPLPPKDLLRILRPNDYDVIDSIEERNGALSDGERRAVRALPRISSAPERGYRAGSHAGDGYGRKSPDEPSSRRPNGGGVLLLPPVESVQGRSVLKSEADDSIERRGKWVPVNEAEARYWQELWDYPPGELGSSSGQQLRDAMGNECADGRHGPAPKELLERALRGSKAAPEVLKHEAQHRGDRERCPNGGGDTAMSDEKRRGGSETSTPSSPKDAVEAKKGPKSSLVCKEEQKSESDEEDNYRRLMEGAEGHRKEKPSRGVELERVSPGRDTRFEVGGVAGDGCARREQQDSSRGCDEVRTRGTRGVGGVRGEAADASVGGGTMRREGMGDSAVEPVGQREGGACAVRTSLESNRAYMGGVRADIMELCGDRAGNTRDYPFDSAKRKPLDYKMTKNRVARAIAKGDGSTRHDSKCEEYSTDGGICGSKGIYKDNTDGRFCQEAVDGVVIEDPRRSEYPGVNRISSASSASSSASSSAGSSCSNFVQGCDPYRGERNDPFKGDVEGKPVSVYDAESFRSRMFSRDAGDPSVSTRIQVHARLGSELLASIRPGREPGVSLRYHPSFLRPPKVEDEAPTPPRPGSQNVDRPAAVPCKVEPPVFWSRVPYDHHDDDTSVGRQHPPNRRFLADADASALLSGGSSVSGLWRSKLVSFSKANRERSRLPVEVGKDYGNGQTPSSPQIVHSGGANGSGTYVSSDDRADKCGREQGPIPGSRCDRPAPAAGDRGPRARVDGVADVRAWAPEAQDVSWDRCRSGWGTLPRTTQSGELCKREGRRFPRGRAVEEDD